MRRTKTGSRKPMPKEYGRTPHGGSQDGQPRHPHPNLGGEYPGRECRDPLRRRGKDPTTPSRDRMGGKVRKEDGKR